MATRTDKLTFTAEMPAESLQMGVQIVCFNHEMCTNECYLLVELSYTAGSRCMHDIL